MKRTQIIDLDGCISDDTARRSLIRPNSHPDPFEWFRAYHRLCHLDQARNLHEVERMNGTRIVVITARPTETKDQTMHWLYKHNIQPYAMIMRNPFDHRPSVEVKRSAVHWLLDYYGVAREDVVDAIDDREDIIMMYRNYFGFPARIIRIGEEGL